MVFRGAGGNIRRLQHFVPFARIGREDRVGLAIVFQHLVFLQDHLVFAAVEADAMGLEEFPNRHIPPFRVGFVIAVDVDLADSESFGGKAFNPASPNFHRFSISRKDSAPEALTLSFESLDFAVDEGDPAVMTLGKLGQDVGVENEHRKNWQVTCECRVQGCVVFEPQIAPEPMNRNVYHNREV